jgi:hypothetical protein
VSLVAFGCEEQVTVDGQALTLRLDFRAITIMEGALQSDMPSIVANFRSGRPQLSVLGQMLWAMLREHHPEVTLDQAAGIMFANEAAKVGFALDALLERAFPLPTEDRKPKNPPMKRRGRSKSSAVAG